jgi:hypothetical protein
MPQPLLRLRQGLMRLDGGDKIMAQILNCVTSHGLEAVLVAAELVIETGALSAEHIINVLARLRGAVAPETVQLCIESLSRDSRVSPSTCWTR